MQLARRIGVLATGVALAVLSLPGSPAEAAAGSVRLSLGASSSYVDVTGQTHVIDYVSNDGGPVETVSVPVQLLDAAGHVLSTGTVYTANASLVAGERSPIDYVFTAPAGYASYRLGTPVGRAAVTAPQRPVQATVTAVDASGTSPYLVQGTATNTSATAVSACKIQLIFTDDAGVVRWVTGTVTHSSRFNLEIPAGATSSWEVDAGPGIPLTWTHVAATTESGVYTGDLQPAPSPTDGIAAVPSPRVTTPDLTSILHLPVLDAPGKAPTSPLPDLRSRAPESPSAVATGDTYRTVSQQRLSKALTWSSLLPAVLGALGVLVALFLITLVGLAILRLRATRPG